MCLLSTVSGASVGKTQGTAGGLMARRWKLLEVTSLGGVVPGQ